MAGGKILTGINGWIGAGKSYERPFVCTGIDKTDSSAML
jgi:hypothetical protein